MMYLACPYSSDDGIEEADRTLASSMASLWVMKIMNRFAYSPIQQYHDSVMVCRENGYDVDKDYVAFHEVNQQAMESSSSVIVLRLSGWRDSTGVQNEIQFFQKEGRDVWFLGLTKDERPDIHHESVHMDRISDFCDPWIAIWKLMNDIKRRES